MRADAGKAVVAVSDETMQLLHECVETGEFASADDALDDAIKVWRLHRAALKDRLDEIRVRLRRSVDDPSPSLSASEAETRMAAYMASGVSASGDATT